MKEIIKSIDIFGKPLQLRLGKQINKTTIFGGIFSFITYLMVCLSLISKIIQYLARSDPSVTYRIVQNTSPKAMNLSEQNLNFIFTLVNSSTFNVIEEIDTYFDFEFLYMKHSKSNNSIVERKASKIQKRNCSEFQGFRLWYIERI